MIGSQASRYATSINFKSFLCASVPLWWMLNQFNLLRILLQPDHRLLALAGEAGAAGAARSAETFRARLDDHRVHRRNLHAEGGFDRFENLLLVGFHVDFKRVAAFLVFGAGADHVVAFFGQDRTAQDRVGIGKKFCGAVTAHDFTTSAIFSKVSLVISRCLYFRRS